MSSSAHPPTDPLPEARASNPPGAAEVVPLQGFEFALGGTAVKLDNLQAAVAVRGNTEPLPPPSVQEVRATLADLNRSQRSTAAKLLALKEMPEALRFMVAGRDTRRNGTLLRRLYAKDRNGDYAVPDATMLNVLQWHNARLSDRQQAFERDVVNPEKTKYKQGVQRAVRQGWMPESASRHLDRLDRTRAVIDDGFWSILKGNHGSMNAFSSGAYEVVIAPNAAPTTFEHEFTHVLEGEDQQDPADAVARAEKRGLSRLFGPGQGAKLLNEAVTDHIAGSLRYGHVDDTDPTSRRHPNVDSVQADLLHTLSKGGMKPVDIRLFINAYCEDQDMRQALGERSAAAQLLAALEAAFPKHDIAAELHKLGTGRKDIAKEVAAFTNSVRGQYRWRKLSAGLIKLRRDSN